MASSSSNSAVAAPAPSNPYQNTEVPEPYFDEKGMIDNAHRLRLGNAMLLNSFNGNYVEVNLDDGKSTSRKIQFVFTKIYSRFGVSEEKEEKKDGSPANNSNNNSNGSNNGNGGGNNNTATKAKNYGLAGPLKQNEKLEPVCKALDKVTLEQYIINAKNYGDENEKELIPKFYVSCAKPMKKKESNQKYGPNMKFKCTPDTQYFLQVGKYQRPVKLLDIAGQKGYFTVMGHISKLHHNTKFNLVFHAEVIIAELAPKQNPHFMSLINIAPPEVLAAEEAARAASAAGAGAGASVATNTVVPKTETASTVGVAAAGAGTDNQGLSVTNTGKGMIKLDDNGICVSAS